MRKPVTWGNGLSALVHEHLAQHLRVVLDPNILRPVTLGRSHIN